MKSRVLFFTILTVGALFLTSTSPAQSRLKVYISADLEGVAGVVTDDQLGPSGFEYSRFREFMTNEVLAAVTAAKAAGADSILVSDSHGNGETLLIERFPEDVRIVRAWPRPLGMMAGIDSTFDAAILIGYHASTNNLRGTRAHTFSSARFTRVAINGMEIPEAAFAAAIAGHFGVPVVMMSGDNAAIAEARKFLGDIEYAETKKTVSFHSAITLTPQAACKLIEEKVLAALRNLKRFKPFTFERPIRLEVGFKHYRVVEMLSYLPRVERIDSHTIRYVSDSIIDVSKFLVFIGTYSPNLQP